MYPAYWPQQQSVINSRANPSRPSGHLHWSLHATWHLSHRYVWILCGKKIQDELKISSKPRLKSLRPWVLLPKLPSHQQNGCSEKVEQTWTLFIWIKALSCRNHYPVPTVEDIAPKLTNAEVFSIVGAKDRFLQVVLDDPSSYLTTFWT